ncbi:MAG TPA: DUF6758 family protein [Nocardioidaceae bacterium]|nr:DUF6758 family protein [Nocardioidaceae bacterium]
MTLAAGCPRCTSPVSEGDDGWSCASHGAITPMWRPPAANYEALAEHLKRCGAAPTLVPWPLAPGWTITDFGCVAEPGQDGRASMLSCRGVTDLDGVVELTVVSEEPNVGLGARCAGTDHTDPGAEIGDGPPHARLRVAGVALPLWSVSTSHCDTAFDRSVFAGEAHGRWLWLVLRPASAALLLRDEWVLADLASLGPELIDVPFGGNPPPW